jgi:hypothetical protein
MNGRLDALLATMRVWRGSVDPTAYPAVSTGWPKLDAALGSVGWPLGTLIELLVPSSGVGELSLLLPALKTLADASEGTHQRWLVWVSPPHVVYPPALRQAGMAAEQILLVDAVSLNDRLWAIEQSLRTRSCLAVLAWVDAVEDRWLRRLKLAAADSAALVVLCRPLAQQAQPSPAGVRIRLSPTVQGLDVHIIKRKDRGALWIRNVLSG